MHQSGLGQDSKHHPLPDQHLGGVPHLEGQDPGVQQSLLQIQVLAQLGCSLALWLISEPTCCTCEHGRPHLLPPSGEMAGSERLNERCWVTLVEEGLINKPSVAVRRPDRRAPILDPFGKDEREAGIGFVG